MSTRPHALITGAGSGIGAAIAQRLHADGWALTLTGRRLDRLQAQRDHLVAAWSASLASADAEASAQQGSRQGSRMSAPHRPMPEVVLQVMDVTDESQVNAAMAAAVAQQGRLDALVNNAGQALAAPLGKTSLAQWQQMLQVNLTGTFLCTQAALPHLQAAAHGRIVNVASTAALKGYAYVAAYCAAKHGVLGFTRALAMELARSRITVNAVCPGYTDTELLDEAVARIVQTTGRTPEEARATLARSNPQHRLIQPEEVAQVVAGLLRPEAQSITGQALAVAGGEVM